MIVEYKTRLCGDLAKEKDSGAMHETDIYDAKFGRYMNICCPTMKKGLDEDSIEFIGYIGNDFPARVGLYIYANDISEDGPIMVNFCPFCGKKVEIRETERVFIRRKVSDVPIIRRIIEDSEEIIGGNKTNGN